ncbi:MAG: hypothetical protein HDR20_12635 [Lachnospiraceae bacterium]|nr:hypothetical protein [Lachnospiraceae bacterium]
MRKFLCQNYWEGLKNICIKYLSDNYDYCYLDAMHTRNRVAGAKTILVGCSHAMYGINESKISEDIINFSIASQDLYYNFKHIQKAIEEGKQKIKRCIINIGYYGLYQDVSLSNSWNYAQLYRVYYPLFGDTHNFHGEGSAYDWNKMGYDRDIYSIELVQKLCQEWTRGFFMEEGSYYGSAKPRYSNIISTNITWNELDEKTKEQEALRRMEDHNRLKKYVQSREENSMLVLKIADYLYQRDIMPVFVIFPFTEWYNRYIDTEYKKEIYDLLDSLPIPVEFWDLNDYKGIFDDDDFCDTDHLNDKGAEKASVLLDEILKG